MSDLKFSDLRAVNVTRCERWHGPDSDPWSLADWSNALCGEAGELANVIKKIRRHETGARNQGDPAVAVLKRMAGLEIADVVIYADLLAKQLGVSLADVVKEKFNAVSEKFGFPERLALTSPHIQRVEELEAALTEARKYAAPENATAMIKRKVECAHNEYWTTHFGNCMACRAEDAEALAIENANKAFRSLNAQMEAESRISSIEAKVQELEAELAALRKVEEAGRGHLQCHGGTESCTTHEREWPCYLGDLEYALAELDRVRGKR